MPKSGGLQPIVQRISPRGGSDELGVLTVEASLSDGSGASAEGANIEVVAGGTVVSRDRIPAEGLSGGAVLFRWQSEPLPRQPYDVRVSLEGVGVGQPKITTSFR